MDLCIAASGPTAVFDRFSALHRCPGAASGCIRPLVIRNLHVSKCLPGRARQLGHLAGDIQQLLGAGLVPSIPLDGLGIEVDHQMSHQVVVPATGLHTLDERGMGLGILHVLKQLLS